jgi:myo-inositol-1(or 4)-monophosphatase
MKAFLDTAIEAAQAAGRIQQFYLDTDLDIGTKSSETDLVTKVDKLCEARIRELIAQAYPDHVVLGEEEGQHGEANYRWIIDPLDGTLNYAHGFPFYCTSVALEHRGDILVGAVFDSTRNELFTAIRGDGAFLNGRRIAVSREADLKKAMLATGFSYQEDILRENLAFFARVHPQARTIRRPGAAALDLCYVACGRLDGFWELSLSPWDVAAGLLIIREAGGTLTGMQGEPYRLDMPRLVATNGHLHMKLIHALGVSQTLAS